MSLSLRFAAGSHKGMIREGNEDSGYAGPRLLAVADGMGGAAAGEVASSEVLSTIVELDEDLPGADLREALRGAVDRANDRLRVMIEDDPGLEGMGTTLTALLWAGTGLGLVHVGDSRAYLLRDGVLEQITQDHTWVQRLVDEGRITEEEAGHHPQRSLLMRALDGRGQVEPDLAVREARAGDRYLVCSDGLSGVVSRETMQDTLLALVDPRDAVQELIQLALRGGGPDNITCIVADIVDVDETPSDIPMVVGAVADDRSGDTATLPNTPASRAHELTAGEYENEALVPETGPPSRRRPKPAWRRTLPIWGPAVVVLAALGGAYWWTQTQYYVARDGDHVAIYRGIDAEIFGFSLSKPYKHYDAVTMKLIGAEYRDSVTERYDASSLDDARNYVAKLKHQSEVCRTVVTWNQEQAKAVSSQEPQTPAPEQPQPSPSPGNGLPEGTNVSTAQTVQAAPMSTPTPAATGRPGSDSVSRSTPRATPPTRTAPAADPSGDPTASSTTEPGQRGSNGTTPAPDPNATTAPPAAAPAPPAPRIDLGPDQELIIKCDEQPIEPS
ncbi:protein phosphatase 2C domain-containing protein [Yinghuangia sp. ASG 101]|uniref:PP2C family protein-serine/threonine phosphatase n=1 Tax=Yinghuangia sp. ASG 101 TaxID=2896848 RepID=UPI001E589F5C|nr:protein phosphatase 2C domain-containing protein [Yinghuangia sp. ASG 101]UGQ15248.1 protein phosphatase 2C domain-containing protein [Yinghuangia sp. ASG 101]